MEYSQTEAKFCFGKTKERIMVLEIENGSVKSEIKSRPAGCIVDGKVSRSKYTD